MKLWVMCDRTKYRLPILVEDSAATLAKKAGVSESTVRSVAFRVMTGEFENGRFECVDIGEMEDDYCDLHRRGNNSGTWRTSCGY